MGVIRMNGRTGNTIVRKTLVGFFVCFLAMPALANESVSTRRSRFHEGP